MNETLISMNLVGRTFLRGRTPVQVLESITGVVAAGDRIAVVGPSGSGKSTLLHLLSGIDSPTTGHIIWPALADGEKPSLQKVGFVFQTSSLFESLTALENVELPLLLAGVTAERASASALQILNELGLEDIVDKLPEELSGGQAQRVAVARAVSSRPPLILMDEPTGQLDQATAQHLFDVLLDSLILPETGLLVATHDLAVAKRMKVIWRLRNGRLEEATRP